MNEKISIGRQSSLPLVGGLILFSVVLGTTDLGYIEVPTEARYATTMHLPTIVASLLEGWPAGFVVGLVFGMTSMFSSGSPMAQDPIVALVPRVLVGLTPYLTYRGLSGYHDWIRLGCAAVVGTLTNTCLFLGFSVVRGFMPIDSALGIALTHGLPEVVLAVVIVIPAVIILRRVERYLNNYST